MDGKIIVIGDSNAQYHPLDNVSALSELLFDYNLTFSDDYDYFLRLNEFCMCVCYTDAWERPLSDACAASLREYVLNGGGLLIIHNGLSLQDTPYLSEMLGARFTHHPAYDKLLVKVDGKHPAAEGVRDFYISDEPYHFDIYGELNIFAHYEYNGTLLPAAWESVFGKGRLIYLMPGHDKSAFLCEDYRRLIRNCVKALSAIVI